MDRPESFILTTDYATLKNDSAAPITLQVTISSGVSIPGNSVYSVAANATVNSNSADIRSIIHSSKNSAYYLVASSTYYMRSGTVLGFPGFECKVYAAISRESATQIRLTAIIKNPYSSPLVFEAGDETITAYITTFISPN